MNEHGIIYANGFRIALGAFETQLTFRIETPIIDNATGDIIDVAQHEVADIRINPSLAKHLCAILQQQLDEHERQFGPLADIMPSVSAAEGDNE